MASLQCGTVSKLVPCGAVSLCKRGCFFSLTTSFPAALDVGGVLAREVWGQQWVRLLALLYEGVTVGYHGLDGRLIGGQTPEGIAARVRVQLEVERIMGAS